jgi:hypothetical protein
MPLRGLLGFVGRDVGPEAGLKASLRRGEVVVASGAAGPGCELQRDATPTAAVFS